MKLVKNKKSWGDYREGLHIAYLRKPGERFLNVSIIKKRFTFEDTDMFNLIVLCEQISKHHMVVH